MSAEAILNEITNRQALLLDSGWLRVRRGL